MSLKKYLQGAYKLGKSVSGIDKTDLDELERRKDICASCKYNTSIMYENHLPISRCKKCGCFIPAKIRLKSEKCPANKW